ncbi:flagellar protein FlaG [Clostridium cavendishii DSM 21758]|uniref:Flagellar protein FlaG n=1 Tax=Clostridium cavendishii DSM 21758 TaxID=1121302 RepID=A0A1M6B3T4_9CLOT|nr:flagellar protein FlaG [Clostridium cavendishii]SHI43327.1 flagellar protein FlaG [Clostridium cavendishii DSM 21758]
MDVKSVSQGNKADLDNYIRIQEVQKVDDTEKVREETATINNKKDDYSEKQIKKSLEKLNKLLEDDNTHAEYSVHEKFGDIMIKIIDDNTKKVIMEVPPKKILDLVAKLCEAAGVIFDKKA